jgi:hypothetical protein
VLPQGISAELRLVATTFSQLQQQRHFADYDITFTTVRSLALTRVEEAENAFAAWTVVRNTDEAAVFLTALAFASQWSK